MSSEQTGTPVWWLVFQNDITRKVLTRKAVSLRDWACSYPEVIASVFPLCQSLFWYWTANLWRAWKKTHTIWHQEKKTHISTSWTNAGSLHCFPAQLNKQCNRAFTIEMYAFCYRWFDNKDINTSSTNITCKAEYHHHAHIHTYNSYVAMICDTFSTRVQKQTHTVFQKGGNLQHGLRVSLKLIINSQHVVL